jgi:hypothetical protein
MWGRPVIRPSNAEEVRHEPAFSGDDSVGESSDEATTPKYETLAKIPEGEDTPRTPLTERLGTPPPPNYDCDSEQVTFLRPYMAHDQTGVAKWGTQGGLSTKGTKKSSTRWRSGWPGS